MEQATKQNLVNTAIEAAKKAYAGNGQADTGALYRVNLRTGEKKLLLDARGGSGSLRR